MITDPLGYFLTWCTYGTWLPGDCRGWVEYQHGWQLPAPPLEIECAARMTEDACRLTPQQCAAVDAQISETCRHRGWELHAVNGRSNHIHVVVSAFNIQPRKIRIDLKAWATRCLKNTFEPQRVNWWADRGSIRYLFNDQALKSAILYTTDAQDRKRFVTRSVSEG